MIFFDFFVTIYLFSVVPAFSSWQTERKAEICSEEKKFEAIFSETKKEKFETIFLETEQEKRKKFEMMFLETKEKSLKPFSQKLLHTSETYLAKDIGGFVKAV